MTQIKNTHSHTERDTDEWEGRRQRAQEKEIKNIANWLLLSCPVIEWHIDTSSFFHCTQFASVSRTWTWSTQAFNFCFCCCCCCLFCPSYVAQYFIKHFIKSCLLIRIGNMRQSNTRWPLPLSPHSVSYVNFSLSMNVDVCIIQSMQCKNS